MANCFISLSKFGTIVAVDTGIQKLLGYEPEELITRPFEDILASPYKELVDIYIYNSAKRFQGGSLTLQPRVLEAQHKDGRYFILRKRMVLTCALEFFQFSLVFQSLENLMIKAILKLFALWKNPKTSQLLLQLTKMVLSFPATIMWNFFLALNQRK